MDLSPELPARHVQVSSRQGVGLSPKESLERDSGKSNGSHTRKSNGRHTRQSLDQQTPTSAARATSNNVCVLIPSMSRFSPKERSTSRISRISTQRQYTDSEPKRSKSSRTGHIGNSNREESMINDILQSPSDKPEIDSPRGSKASWDVEINEYREDEAAQDTDSQADDEYLHALGDMGSRAQKSSEAPTSSNADVSLMPNISHMLEVAGRAGHSFNRSSGEWVIQRYGDNLRSVRSISGKRLMRRFSGLSTCFADCIKLVDQGGDLEQDLRDMKTTIEAHIIDIRKEIKKALEERLPNSVEAREHAVGTTTFLCDVYFHLAPAMIKCIKLGLETQDYTATRDDLLTPLASLVKVVNWLMGAATSQPKASQPTSSSYSTLAPMKELALMLSKMSQRLQTQSKRQNNVRPRSSNLAATDDQSLHRASIAVMPSQEFDDTHHQTHLDRQYLIRQRNRRIFEEQMQQKEVLLNDATWGREAQKRLGKKGEIRKSQPQIDLDADDPFASSEHDSDGPQATRVAVNDERVHIFPPNNSTLSAALPWSRAEKTALIHHMRYNRGEYFLPRNLYNMALR